MKAWHGEKVRLRAIEPDEWQRFHGFDQDTESQRSSHYVPFPRSKEASRRWTEAAATATPEDDNVRLAIETVDRVLVGSLSVHHADRRNGTFEYGIAIAREHWGRGYAADAIRVLLRYYFDELRYQKVNAGAYAFNTQSRRLHEKLGFVEEGRIRSVYYTDGEYHDEIRYGMTVEEFRVRERGEVGGEE